LFIHDIGAALQTPGLFDLHPGKAPAKLGSTDRSIDVSSLKILQEDPRKDQKSNPTAIPAIHADLLELK